MLATDQPRCSPEPHLGNARASRFEPLTTRLDLSCVLLLHTPSSREDESGLPVRLVLLGAGAQCAEAIKETVHRVSACRCGGGVPFHRARHGRSLDAGIDFEPNGTLYSTNVVAENTVV